MHTLLPAKVFDCTAARARLPMTHVGSPLNMVSSNVPRCPLDSMFNRLDPLHLTHLRFVIHHRICMFPIIQFITIFSHGPHLVLSLVYTYIIHFAGTAHTIPYPISLPLLCTPLFLSIITTSFFSILHHVVYVTPTVSFSSFVPSPSSSFMPWTILADDSQLNLIIFSFVFPHLLSISSIIHTPQYS